MAEYLYWFIAGAAMILFEIVVPGFVLVWFGIGAIAAGIAAFLGAGYTVQFIVFFVVSIGSLIPAKIFLKKKEEEPSLRVGAERVIGMKGIVTKEISPSEFGEVKIEGELWIASSGEEIQKGEWVVVEKIEGTHLVVRRQEKN